jgi:hypothetical protein
MSPHHATGSTIYLGNGSLYTVYRTETAGAVLCQTYSDDDGAHWAVSTVMDGPVGVEPKLLRLPSGRIVRSPSRSLLLPPPPPTRHAHPSCAPVMRTTRTHDEQEV